MKTPTTIVTGFLGSGKTTIILHLVKQLQAKGIKVAYIKNEIGETDVDTEIMRGQNIVSRELLNGCICCTLVGPFISAITEVVETYHPDRIIIEASGTADPVALALMVSSHELLNRDGVISVIDVLNFEGYEDLTTTAQAQTKLTDLILFNKVELVDDARKQAVVGYVRELNTHSPILETHKGEINADVIFGISSVELDALLTAAENTADHNHSSHLTDDELEGFTCWLPAHIDKYRLQTFLEALPKTIFRVKGFVIDDQSQVWLVNKVGTRVTFDAVPSIQNQTEGRLVFIGYQATSHHPEIQHQLESLAASQ